MARDANALKYPESWKDAPEDLKKLPPPDGVNKAEWDAKISDGTYYANVKVYQDGRQVVEWYKRGVGGGPGQPDPVQARSQGVLPTVKEEWDKDEEKPPATRNINGVPHQVTGKDANGQDIWTPVQTASGPASPTTGASTEKTWRTEGTPDPSQPSGYDNSRPMMAAYVGGKRTGETRQPTAEEIKDWNLAGQMTRNPGGKTDAEIAAEKDKADAAAARNAPRPVSTNTTEPYIVQAGPDGKLITSPNPNYVGEKPQRATVKGEDGKTYVVTVDKDGNGTAKPVEGLPAERKPGQVVTLNGESYWATPNADPGQPPTLTRMDPTTSPKDNGPQLTPGMSGSEYLTARRAWLMEQRRAGVGQKEIDALWDSSVQTATARQNEANTAATQQNQRLSSSMSGFDNALKTASDLASYAPVGSDLAGKGFEGLLTLQRAQAQRMGGYGPDPSSMVAAIPGPPPMNPPSPSGSAVGPVAAGVTATTAAAVNPTGANVQAANDATMQGSQAAFGALGVPPAAAPPPAPAPPSFIESTTWGPQGQDQPPVSAIPESPYDFQAWVKMTPPWKMDEDTYRRAVARGLERDFWQTGAA